MCSIFILLPTTHPDVYQQMLKGVLSFAKTKSPFSRMALDQVHGPNDKIIKGVGGVTRSYKSFKHAR